MVGLQLAITVLAQKLLSMQGTSKLIVQYILYQYY